MPKIIPELREKMLSCARAHLMEDDGHDFSTRQLASECGIAAGTVYNYFSTKEEILACIMLEDWKVCLKKMQEEAEHTEDIRCGFAMIEQQLRAFSAPFLVIWQRYDRVPIPKYHALLIRQIEQPLKILLERTHRTCGETERAVLSEMLLSCSQREEGLIEKLIPVMEKLLDRQE